MWAGSVGSPTVILGIEADAVFQLMLRSIMIPWRTIIDPDDGSHEYKAYVAGVEFYIWRAIGPRFGISARRRLPNGTSEQLTHSGDIEWYDTLEECKARAERILRDHQVSFTDNDARRRASAGVVRTTGVFVLPANAFSTITSPWD